MSFVSSVDWLRCRAVLVFGKRLSWVVCGEGQMLAVKDLSQSAFLGQRPARELATSLEEFGSSSL